jgi:mono/diheme cytochrome c family protein
MTWLLSPAASATAVIVPAGVGLAAFLAWLITTLSPGDPLGFPVAESAPATGPAQSAQNQDMDPVALEQGRVYYAQLCMSCHGVRGDGSGEWAYRVTPRPADLTGSRTRKRSDAQLYEIISEGLPGTAMIGWKRQLSEEQRRQLVVYVRSLSQGGGKGVRHE